MGVRRDREERVGYRHQAVTASDATTYENMIAVRCTTGGTLVGKDQAGTSVTYTMVAGEVLWFSFKQIMAASTAVLVAWF